VVNGVLGTVISIAVHAVMVKDYVEEPYPLEQVRNMFQLLNFFYRKQLPLTVACSA